MGPFSTLNAAFASFLFRRGAAPQDELRFVARNFLLDEGIVLDRARSYEAAGAAANHADDASWQTFHRAYLLDAVNKPRPPGPGSMLDPEDSDHCAETFRHFDEASPFLMTDLGLDLIRTITLDFVRTMTGETLPSLRALSDRVARANCEGASGGPDHDALDAILEEWLMRVDGRPVFAGFWEDVKDLFGPDPDSDPAAWADELRDRCGLAHHDPGVLGPVPILVFRYPVRDVLRVRGTDRTARLLVAPTVLDSTHSPAFCPAPGSSVAGHTVELACHYELPRREVVHPPVDFRARHVLRVGEIKRPVPADLGAARGLHLVYLQERSTRPDYASTTDRDLL